MSSWPTWLCRLRASLITVGWCQGSQRTLKLEFDAPVTSSATVANVQDGLVQDSKAFTPYLSSVQADFEAQAARLWRSHRSLPGTVTVIITIRALAASDAGPGWHWQQVTLAWMRSGGARDALELLVFHWVCIWVRGRLAGVRAHSQAERHSKCVMPVAGKRAEQRRTDSGLIGRDRRRRTQLGRIPQAKMRARLTSSLAHTHTPLCKLTCTRLAWPRHPLTPALSVWTRPYKSPPPQQRVLRLKCRQGTVQTQGHWIKD